MLWLLSILLLSASALAAAGFLLPVSLSSHLQGRAEPNGTWALALGLGKGPLALSAVAVSGVAPFIACHLFGKQILRLPLLRGADDPRKPAPESASSSEGRTISRIGRRLRRGFRRVDPVDAWLTWWDKTRVFEVSALELELEYSFRDVALTGQILAGLCVLSGVLPERYVIHHSPVWECEDRCAVVADLRFRIWPGRLLVHLLVFVLKHWKLGSLQATSASE